jgi:hypothetical protein|tara:strand:+ start:52 stop:189 length:138 start_codon:yes stop_codon:yes gene_type:complete
MNPARRAFSKRRAARSATPTAAMSLRGELRPSVDEIAECAFLVAV